MRGMRPLSDDECARIAAAFCGPNALRNRCLFAMGLNLTTAPSSTPASWLLVISDRVDGSPPPQTTQALSAREMGGA